MKRFIHLVLLLMMSISFTMAQSSVVIESFDSDIAADTTYQISTEGSPSRMDFTLNTTDFREGTGSGNADIVIGSFHSWGSYSQLIKRVPDGQPLYDWTISDSLAIWIKVVQAPSLPASIVFRIHIADRPTETDPIEEYIYEHATVLDAVGDWFELKLPIRILSTDGSLTPVDSGFVIFPASWGGGNFNNRQFDSDKIIGYNISAISTSIAEDSLKVIFDGFRRFGVKAIPLVVFNGITLLGNMSQFTWGQSAVSVETGAGPQPGTNAIKWIQGDEWANGWTGFGYNVSPSVNLSGAWLVDSMKFKLKCEAGTGPLRIQVEGGGGKIGTVFQPIADDQWHEYAFPFREMVYQDNSTSIDSTNINVVGLMAEASGVAGRVLWITDWWSGNPDFDVIAPPPPTSVLGLPGTYSNLITWIDALNEAQEKYHIYYKHAPITDPDDAEVVKLNVGEGVQTFSHLLRAPVTDQDVTYYYAMQTQDQAGNISELSEVSAPVTNTAKGVTTISLNAPTSTFVADGSLTEWAGITPIHMALSDGSAFLVTNSTITNDDDLSLDAYVAVDNNYLYIAFDVEDDIISFNPALATYLNDAPDIFLGLYNWHGKPHTTYRRGSQPDYHFRMSRDRCLIDGLGGGDSLLVPGTDYYWDEKFPTGYVVEARIAFSELSNRFNDDLFVPLEGMRIPMDFSINDADATGEREGIMTYSPYNEDQSWSDVSRWLYTWIGALWNPVGVDDPQNTVLTYELSQNYPNPFNPATQIVYSIEKPGNVSIKVYDVLGRVVTTLVDQFKTAGSHTINFDASNLSSGVYFYSIESGSFHATKKMMLIK
ncbi:MAG: T9SS type A sorting domain-containing protein [Ignavibacteriales bacterium]|nr:MAG: T9SS type A sorting domain-containing protein [Ignavibacteriales bacterium]